MSNSLPKKEEKNRGFSLVELLVVVGIIAILISVVIVGSQTVRSRGRDAQVRSDVSTIILAFERFRNNSADSPNYRYPGVYNQVQCLKASGTCWGGAYNGNSTISANLANYLSTIPTPPGTKSGELRHDAYLFYSGSSDPFGLGIGNGSWLVWPQEKPIPDCKGLARQESDGIYYCYQLLR
ncbi:MAG: hypothetical protein A2653_01360 [Candidatus Zambryskibacteria bacterium RIFCSPHIGHO2_01_FULL_43_25]|uniref:Type II secretion system protein GspG C-terminal domain-containing protein n=1 Tax=Candidatus Zambryskibacteria bacterium RIFCSPLOWO2_01_FULL_45_21 TaxID=1802761 RepID=A0A1G2U5P3_9BACT|nr:MAG: hypothetical protein A2653_01360 [Candidatus Zambryskibacteria bacterium RIFCSPHIGHO2_01_FULL_43_25]OHB00397.1 MAG: hypothetical protein A3E94_01680 [Candidatus Zambryskibacteria bacterium RIFCSPHIGHO2_12_FULL_44_12b]OHB04192.1 MAG: hypothetical protein A3B14_02155 [Candidatus Zambryskibacteria bacterium RIFCSPLOWO2_01_FULL_45_21]